MKKRWESVITGRSCRTQTQANPNRSAKSGVIPSAPSRASPTEMSDVAKARLQETAIMRVHRRLQAKNVERCITGCASRLCADAKSATKSRASLLHRPPVLMATTTRWHRAPLTNSAYLASLSRRAFTKTTPFDPASLVHAMPWEVSALRSVSQSPIGLHVAGATLTPPLPPLARRWLVW